MCYFNKICSNSGSCRTT